MLKYFIPFIASLLLCACSKSSPKTQYYPGDTWKKYERVTDAGFSPQALEKAETFSDSLQSASVLILHEGKILANWGDATRRLRTTSIRKSLLNAIIGIKVNQGKLNISDPVGEFKISGMKELTKTEASATLEDLLTSSSGIYLPASYESDTWTKRKPERGIHQPGEHWYYNNWDFNTLGAIYETIADSNLNYDFNKFIAEGIGMQDYRPKLDFKYFAEPGVSKIPAYLFKMSTRDLARFGLLYLRNGEWNGKQLIPGSWVNKNTSQIMNPWENTGYGFLWWTTNLNDSSHVYYANGSGVQGIYVVPDKDLVMVFRANTYFGPNISDESALQLLQMVVEAKQMPSKINSPLSDMHWNSSKNFPPLDNFKVESWIGSYQNNIARRITIEEYEDKLLLKTAIADFLMYPTSDSTVWVESLEVEAKLDYSNPDKNGESILNKNNLIIYK